MSIHDDEIQNDVLGEQPDLGCIDRLGAALTHVPDVPSKRVSDPVSHPTHYTAYPVEVIQLTEHMNFCRGNAVKYVARAGLKDPSKTIEDLEKAVWYLNREIQRLKEQP